MCGIFGSLGGSMNEARLAVQALAHRGPDAHRVVEVDGVVLGHTRLSILDLDKRSNQPFKRGPVTISFNGEIWNYRALRAWLESYGSKFTTTGDTEVLAELLRLHGEKALPMLQGMFAVAWTDGSGTLYAARDRFGEVPLHCHLAEPFMVASEVKALLAAGAHPDAIHWVEPGSVLAVAPPGTVVRRRLWYGPYVKPAAPPLAEAAVALGALVVGGAQERAISDVPVCTLLSGGIDSAAVALALKERYPDLVAYTAVLDPKSRDLRAARVVAEALGVELREVPVAAPLDSELAAVVRAIEMPHKAQVEIGWACLALARRMRADGFKVTFSGEGSDELWASYGFAYHALKTQGWHEYRRDLFRGQHRKNFARCNKVFMAHGVECRLPFLSTPLVEYALSLAQTSVQRKGRPKAVLQDAFAGRLPESIVRRPKLAFQDGLKLKAAIAATRSDPKALYARAFDEAFPGVAT